MTFIRSNPLFQCRIGSSETCLMSVISTIIRHPVNIWTTSLLVLRVSGSFCANRIPGQYNTLRKSPQHIGYCALFSSASCSLGQRKMADASRSGAASDEVEKAQKMEPSSAPSIFTRIMNKEIPGKFLYEDEQCVVIVDVNPQAPVHFLVVPRRQLEGLSYATDADEPLLGHLLNVARKVAEQEKLSSGYRVVINEGKHGAQSVAHLHIHVFGKRQMGWPPG